MQSGSHHQPKREDELKLRTLRHLIDEAIAQIERGECEIIEPGGIDKFIEKIAAKAKRRKS
jgi:hypothetical protein